MRRRRPQSQENHERWMVSYADFVTLLFAFFVVMFATAHADKSRAKAVSEAIEKALKNGAVSPAISSLLKSKPDRVKPATAPLPESLNLEKGSPDRAAAEELAKPLEVLSTTLKDEIKRGSIRLAMERRGLIVELQTGALFPSGEATLSPAAYATVQKVATVLNTLPNALRLEGHTDSLPINNSRFQSNWELSAERSIAMLRFLNEKFEVARERMAIVGFADNDSIGSNDTEEGRERNRRVDIVILSSYGMRSEPTPRSKRAAQSADKPEKQISNKKF